MTDRFEITETALKGVKVLRRRVLTDDRGFLERLFCAKELEGLMAGRTINQINRTLTAKHGTVRGLHFQLPPHAEAKFVTCLRGKVFDVTLDLRRGSSTFLEWRGHVLTASDATTLFIPEGIAHGFQTLEGDCELLYFHTAHHEPEAEGGINARDPRIAIEWPEPITNISTRDSRHPLLEGGFEGIAL